MFRSHFLITVAALSMLAASSASATALFSEDFSGATPGGGAGPGGAYPGSIPGTQFSVVNGNVDILGVVNGSNFSCVGNPGGNCLDLIGNVGVGEIRSTPSFNLIAGDTYTLTFGDILQGGATLAPESFSVSLGGVTRTETSLSTGPTLVTEIFTPTANQAGAQLDFASITNDNGANGPVLYNIVLSVPEPASLMLLGAGLLGLGVIRRKAA